MYDRHAIYRTWAPADSPWSAWVKPVPFATMDILCERDDSDEAPPPVSGEKLPIKPGQAVLVDLPGPDSVSLGLWLARAAGYRPIPVFASCTAETSLYLHRVDTMRTQRALIRGARELGERVVSRDALPAFLVDFTRSGAGRELSSHRHFDNRSALFPSDFPSGGKLLENGIKSCAVIRDQATPLGDDLRYALLPWKKAGIEVTVLSLTGESADFPWPPTFPLVRLWHRLALTVTLRRNLQGGYGRFVQESSGG